MAPVVYTGSIGMYSPSDVDPATGRLEEDAEAHPGNHYGVYKLANEGTARVYWADYGVPSVGLRPMTVYGAGRDQGMTSSPTVAIAAAVLGEPYEIAFGGRTLFQYAEDVARTLHPREPQRPAAARPCSTSAATRSHLDDWVAAIEDAVPEAAGRITVAPTELPFPADIAHDCVAELGDVPVTPYRDAIAATAAIYRRLAEEHRLVGSEQGIPSAAATAGPCIDPPRPTGSPPPAADHMEGARPEGRPLPGLTGARPSRPAGPPRTASRRSRWARGRRVRPSRP